LLIVEKQRRELAQHEREVYRLEGSAFLQYMHGELAEGDKSFRQAFSIRRQFLGGQPPQLETVAIFTYIVTEEGDNKSHGLDALLAEFPKPALLSIPGYAILFGRFAESLAETGRWTDATNDLANYVKYEPDSPEAYHSLAPVLVACGSVSEYRRLCREIIRRFGGTKDPLIADPMAKDCLILPSSGADLKAVATLADVAVTRGTNYPSYPLFMCCKALAEYRQEHFAEAIQWAGSAANDSFPYSKAEAYAILSMARFSTGQTNEALTALADCADVIEKKLPKLSSGNLGGDWRDWIIAHALQSEAKQMIGGEPSTTALPANLPR
jgi:tetratricopeptide (TPR) repeat protein